MSQYIINVKNEKQSDALLKYLRSLDFIEVKAMKPTTKAKSISEAKAFLKGLPNQNHTTNAVTKAVKEIRKKYEYQ